MRLFEIFWVALRGISGNKLRSFLTMLGVVMGVGSVITLISIGEGVRTSISEQIQGLGSNLVIVTPGTGTAGTNISTLGGATSELSYEDALAVEGSNDVKNVAPVIESSGYAAYKERRATLITGTSESYSEVRNIPMASGDFFSRADIRGYRQVAVVGDYLKRELFIGVNPIGKTIKINDEEYTVIGVAKKKGRTLTIENDNRIYIPITMAEQLLDTKEVSMMFVQSTSPDTVKNAMEETRRIIMERHGKKDFAISEQKDILNTLDGIMDTLSGMLGGIAGVSLLVGGIGIMNIMLVTVTERTREIGLRKAVGARRRDILFQFIMESVFISAFGGLIGIAVGLTGSRLLQNALPQLPTTVTPWSITVSFLFSLLVGLFFGIYPARKAARLDPIEALRYE